MKVCIYGAGAIGGWIGVHLAQTGHEVSVVARGVTLEALQKNGLQCVQTQAADARIKADVKVSAQPADLGPQDLVIVAVKAPAMADVAKGIARHGLVGALRKLRCELPRLNLRIVLDVEVFEVTGRNLFLNFL